MFFPAGDETLFGVLTQPSVPNRAGVVVLRGGGYTVAADRDLLWGGLAARLAARGYHLLRFDYHGVGDSTGAIEAIRMDRPFEEDLAAGIDWMRRRDVARYVLVGQCFGARTVLVHAPKVDGLAGLVLIAPPLRDMTRGEGTASRLAYTLSAGDYVRRGLGSLRWRELLRPSGRRRYLRLAVLLLNAKVGGLRRRLRPPSLADGAHGPAWVSSRFLDPLERLVARGTPILLIFGTEDGLEEFEEAKAGRLGEILERSGDLVEVVTLAGKVHGRAPLGNREATRDLIADWIHRRVG